MGSEGDILKTDEVVGDIGSLTEGTIWLSGLAELAKHLGTECLTELIPELPSRRWLEQAL